MKLSIRVPLLIGIIVLVSSSSIGVTAVLISGQALEASAKATLVNEVSFSADFVSLKLESELDMLQQLANRDRTQTMDWETVYPNLVADVKLLGYLDMALVYPDGTARYVLEDTTANLGDRDYIKKALAGEQAISEVLISRVNNTPVVMYAVPITTQEGDIILGALIGRKDAKEALNSIMAMLKTSFKTGYAFMTDMSGTFACYSDINMVLDQFNPIEAAKTDPSLQSLANRVSMSLRESTGFYRYSYRGKNLASSHIAVPGFHWILFLSVEQAEFTEGLVHLRYVLIVLGTVFVLVGITAATFTGRSIARPIVRVAVTLKDISEGEGDLTRQVAVSSRDEIGDLAHYFNQTLEKIKNLIVIIEKQTVTLFDIGSDLSANMTESAAAINEITANIQSIKGRVINQSAAVTETNAAMEQITGSIDSLNGNIEKQTDSVSRSSSAIEEMLANIQSVTQTLVKNADNVRYLAEASNVGHQGLRDVAADIQEIARESEGLLEINGVMENIASQTNLLSMNAAIEAAHAGEAGKGFAVVAGEIRKLAESSSEQSQTISIVLKKIKTSIDKIMPATDNVLNKFEAIGSGIKTVAEQEEGIRNAMEEQGAGSRQILESISQLNEVTQMVQNGSTEMLEGSRQVITEGKNLEMATTEITNGMNEMAIGAEQINIAVNEVNNLSSRNKDNIDILVQEVSRFKIK
ncbi:methyl-accepting chemotaxis protein [Spirochaetia bacterium]|nr:methyl-accepting chemotaxis protein [Spirochaetia bacterium]